MSIEKVPQNVYENQDGPLDAETQRLRTFDAPTQVSIEALGTISQDDKILDIGAGENPTLRGYIQQHGGNYIASDIRFEATAEQLQGGALAVQGDAKNLAFSNESLNATHARFVLGHFPAEARKQLVSEALRVLKPGGKAVLIDYDWTKMHGSDAVNAVRDFTLNNITIFDASYGSKSQNEIQEFVGEEVAVSEVRKSPPLMTEYAPLISLRQVTLAGLERQQSSNELKQQASQIFDLVEQEAASADAPGFYMPDMVTVVVTKQ
jgi:ubiquinone/menaquinone biosynthesis C-methylase UbiE